MRIGYHRFQVGDREIAFIKNVPYKFKAAVGSYVPPVLALYCCTDRHIRSPASIIVLCGAFAAFFRYVPPNIVPEGGTSPKAEAGPISR